MKPIFVNKTLISIPESWEELQNDFSAISFVMPLFFKNLTETQLLTRASFHFMKLSQLKQYMILQEFNKHPNSLLSDNIATEVFRVNEIITFITQSPPSIDVNFFATLGNLRGTIDIHRDFVAWEYALSEHFFFAYAKNPASQTLNKFLAIWYRKKGEKFTENNIEKRAQKLAKFPEWKKYVAFLFFASQRESIAKKYTHIFRKTKKPTKNANDWADTLLSLSAVGDEDKVANTKLSIILRRLNYSAKAAEEQQKQYDKASK